MPAPDLRPIENSTTGCAASSLQPRNRWLIWLSLLAGIAAVYFPVVNFQFLNWDDGWYVVQNDLIQQVTLENLYRIATEPLVRNYAPLTLYSYLVEFSLWGLWPGGYHITNVCLHALNAILVFQLIRQLTGRTGLAWFTAALFALHPVQVETVAWIASRKSLLSSTFLLTSFICWLRPQRSGRDEAWGTLWLLLSLFSKAAGVTFPAIVVAYDVLIARRKFRDSAVRQVIPAFLCVQIILFTMTAQTTTVGGVRSHLGLSKFSILLVDATLLWRYVGTLLWPAHLNVLYAPPFQGIPGLMALAVTGWLVVAAVLWRIRQRFPLVLFGCLTALFLLLPVLNLFPLTTLMNDRYLYLPCIAFFAIAGAVLTAGCDAARHAARLAPGTSSRNLRPLFATAALALVAATCVRTHSYLAVWKKPLTLWSHARKETPELTVVQFQWALTLHDLNRPQEAKDALRYALSHCLPDEADTLRIEKQLQAWGASAQRISRAAAPGVAKSDLARQ